MQAPPGILKHRRQPARSAAPLPLAEHPRRCEQQCRPENRLSRQRTSASTSACAPATRCPLALKVRSGAPPYTWFADGAPIGVAQYGGALNWEPRGPGFVKLTVIDARGASTTSSVYLE
jgi:membrane carboxypeptidase/penicillin-binding protein PbpC